MALDPREFRKRRHQREQQRYKQRERRKALLIRLGIAAAVVVGCLILILILGSYDSPSAPEATAPVSAVTDPTGTTENPELIQSQSDPTSPTVDDNTTVIHLAAAGDLNLTPGVVNSYEGDYSYTGLFLDVAPLLAGADITSVNLEGNFFTDPYGEDYNAPPALAEALNAAGVDLVQLANSFSIYKGMAGLSQTYQTVKTAGMEPVGAWPDSDTAKSSGGYTLCSVKGVKIAFVSFTKGMNGMALPPGSEDCVNLLYTDYSTDYQNINTSGIKGLLEKVRGESPDLIVALVHWGSEYNNTISSSQEAICDLLQDNGVDAIIGTHSHYVQQMDYDPVTGSFVAYSLGDFMGDRSRAGSEYSVILDLEITKDHSSGRTRVTDFSYTPIYTALNPDGTVRVLRIEEAIRAYDDRYIDRVTAEDYDAMQYALERIEARIKGE